MLTAEYAAVHVKNRTADVPKNAIGYASTAERKCRPQVGVQGHRLVHGSGRHQNEIHIGLPPLIAFNLHLLTDQIRLSALSVRANGSWAGQRHSIAERFKPRISADGDLPQSTVSSMGTSNADFPEANVVRVAADLLAARQPFALTIVIEATGSTSAHPGDKAVFDTEGTILSGWIGGGCAESTIAHAVVESLADATPRIVDVDLDDDVLGAGMPCGGRMKVYVEPFPLHPKLWILGHGRIAECLCHFGAMLSFDVTVDDTMASPSRYPEARRVIVDDRDYSALVPAASDFVVIATQHRGDHESLRRLLAGETGHIALIASRKRADLVLDYLRAAASSNATSSAFARRPASSSANARPRRSPSQSSAKSSWSAAAVPHVVAPGTRQTEASNHAPTTIDAPPCCVRAASTH